MNFNFGEVLTRAWQIIWKHKVLWIFGILASCTRGSGSGNGGGGGSGGGSGGGDNPFPADIERAFENFGEWFTDNMWIIAVVAAVLLILWILFIFLGAIGRIGLIRGTVQAESGAERLDFGELFGGSLPYFWRVFGLSFLIGLAVFLILVPIIAIGVLTAGVGFLCLLPLICILIPVMWVVNIVLEQANVAIVTEDLGMFDGLRRGWEAAKNNAGPVIVMALILAVISFVVGVVIAIPILIIVFPTIFAFALGQGEDYTPLIVAGVCIVAYLPVSILLNGVLSAYLGSAWTLTYTRLARPKQDLPAPIQTNA